MSFAFSCNLDSWSQDGEGMYIRTILNAELYELSIVAQPAYPASTAALRSQFGTPTVPTIKAPIEDNKEVELPYDNTDDLLLALILSLRS
jgi:phage head maturation protease